MVPNHTTISTSHVGEIPVVVTDSKDGEIIVDSSAFLADIEQKERKLLRGLIRSGLGRPGKGKKRGTQQGYDAMFGNNTYTVDNAGTFTFCNRFVTSLGTDGTGLLSTGTLFLPSSATQWASQSSLFDEFRIVSLRFSLLNNRGSSAILEGPIYVAMDDDAISSTAPTSNDVMLQYGNVWFGDSTCTPGTYSGGVKVPPYTYLCTKNPNISGTVTSSIPSTPLGDWCDIASVSSTQGALLIRASGLSVSATYFLLVTEYVIEFRQVR